MFTGIITHLGKVVAMDGTSDRDLWIETDIPPDAFATGALAIGASVAHSGVCLTVVEKTANRHRVQASAETLARTTLGHWQIGTRVNIENSLRLGSELGGHIVFGHVDATAPILAIDRLGDSWRFRFGLPETLAPLVAVKGSISIDGISLTVTSVDDTGFEIVVIPHSYEVTTLSERRVDDLVNLEADMLARYVQRQISFAQGR
ncbi:MAG: riboflavin synthase [Pseudomonadota bacterium]